MSILKNLLTLAFAGLLALPCLAGGDEVILKTGTLDDYDRTTDIIYQQTITLPINPDLGKLEDGKIQLGADPKDYGNVTLTFYKDDAARRIGSFPQSVGNPLFMYFVETVIRDMSNFAGGSPFYIRNRVKDALVNRVMFSNIDGTPYGTETPIILGEMQPFEADPNRDRMRGFQDLIIRVGMSDDITGWYAFLEASASVDGEVVYRRQVELQR